MNQIRKIPDEWIYIDLNEVLIYNKGKKPKRLNSSKFQDAIPYLDIKAIETGKIDRWASLNSSKITSKEEIIIVWDGARSGWVGLSKYGALGSTLASIKPVLVDQLYLYYFLKGQFDYINQNTKGVGIPHVNPEILLKIQFPLAPLKEQMEIAKKIQYFFKKLDKTKDSLDKVFRFINNLKISILDSAAKGKMFTNNLELKQFRVEEVIDSLKYGTSKKSFYKKEGTPILRIPNLSDFKLNKDDLKYSKLSENEREKYKVNKGDLLLIRSNGSVNLLGRTSIVTEEFSDMCYAGYLIRIRPNNEIITSEFLNYIFHSTLIRNQIESISRSTSGVNNINTKEINNLKILLPSINNQIKITNKIEKIFNEIEILHSKLKSLELNINELHNSILQKSYTGALSKRNNDSRGIEELLSDIRKEKKKLMANIKAQSILHRKLKKPKNKENVMNIIDVLKKNNNPMQATEVWKKSKFSNNIDEFYNALKKNVEENQVRESEDKEYIELV